MRSNQKIMLSALIAAFIVGSAMAQAGEARRGQQRRPDDAPKVGMVAPTFKLKSLDGKNEFELESFRSKRPVILFFGSYT